MLQYTLLGPRRLWTVTQSGAVTNERAAGISPENPIQINPNLIGAMFHLRAISIVNITLGAVIVYGALHPVGGAAPFYFPAVGAANQERLVTFTNVTATGQGAIREPMATDSDLVVTRQAVTLMPNVLLLEYTTSAPGAGPVVTFEVWASMIGPMPGGSQ